MFGFRMPNPGDLIQMWPNVSSPEEYFEKIFPKVEKQREQMRQKAHKTLIERATYKNKNRAAKTFQLGQLVLHRQLQAATGVGSSLHPKFTGPYVISKINFTKCTALLEHLKNDSTIKAHFSNIQKFEFDPRNIRLPSQIAKQLLPSISSDSIDKLTTPKTSNYPKTKKVRFASCEQPLQQPQRHLEPDSGILLDDDNDNETTASSSLNDNGEKRGEEHRQQQQQLGKFQIFPPSFQYSLRDRLARAKQNVGESHKKEVKCSHKTSLPPTELMETDDDDDIDAPDNDNAPDEAQQQQQHDSAIDSPSSEVNDHHIVTPGNSGQGLDEVNDNVQRPVNDNDDTEEMLTPAPWLHEVHDEIMSQHNFTPPLQPTPPPTTTTQLRRSLRTRRRPLRYT